MTASRVGASAVRRILAACLGGPVFVAGALVTQATVGDNPIALAIDDLLGPTIRDEAPVWFDVARQFGLSVFAVGAVFSLAIGLAVRPSRALPAALLAGLAAGLAFAATTLLLDQVVGMTITGRDGGSQMPRVALIANLVAGIAGSAVALAVLTRGAVRGEATRAAANQVVE